MNREMKAQDFIEYWHKHQCASCEITNWTYHSHSQRHCTGLFLNTDACKCWRCGRSYWLGEPRECEPTIQDGNPHSYMNSSNMNQPERVDELTLLRDKIDQLIESGELENKNGYQAAMRFADAIEQIRSERKPEPAE